MAKSVYASLAALLFVSIAGAQETKLVNPDLFCRVDQFTSPMGKKPVTLVKRCDRLKDQAEVAVKSLAECKERTLAKGQECAEASGQAELAVVGKFIEKFSVSHNATSFTCAISKVAGNQCP